MRQEFRCPDCGSSKFGTSLNTETMERDTVHCHGHGCSYTASPELDYQHFITIPETIQEAELLANLYSVIQNAAGPFEAIAAETPI